MTANTRKRKVRPSSTPARTERRYTVSYVPGKRINDTLALHICEKWLRSWKACIEVVS